MRSIFVKVCLRSWIEKRCESRGQNKIFGMVHEGNNITVLKHFPFDVFRSSVFLSPLSHNLQLIKQHEYYTPIEQLIERFLYC